MGVKYYDFFSKVYHTYHNMVKSDRDEYWINRFGLMTVRQAMYWK